MSEVDRRDCPFYGRNLIFSSRHDLVFLADQRGNQCALITSAFAPCLMETAGIAPFWPICDRNPEINGSYEDPVIGLSDDMLKAAFAEACPGVDAMSMVAKAAEKSAAHWDAKGKPYPDHLVSALDAVKLWREKNAAELEGAEARNAQPKGDC